MKYKMFSLKKTHESFIEKCFQHLQNIAPSSNKQANNQIDR